MNHEPACMPRLQRLQSVLALLFGAASIAAAASPVGPPVAGTDSSLPFDRTVINRYSLDGMPRSLSIRQGGDVWFGYDLEGGVLRKVWQAPAGKPGVLTTAFLARSAGTAWFEDASRESWQLARPGETVPLAVRYRGCVQRDTYFELTWELRHATETLILRERIPRAGAAAPGRAVRELHVEHLAAGEALLLPLPTRRAWISSASGATPTALTGGVWHRLILP
jgi:hypothetical protein